MFDVLFPLFSMVVALIFFPLAGFLCWEAFSEWRKQGKSQQPK
jgi:hypothetical protein